MTVARNICISYHKKKKKNKEFFFFFFFLRESPVAFEVFLGFTSALIKET